MKSGNLNLLEPSGPHQVCFGTDCFTFTSIINFCVISTLIFYEDRKTKSYFTVPNYIENKSAQYLIKLEVCAKIWQSVRNNDSRSAKYGKLTVHTFTVFQMHHISQAKMHHDFRKYVFIKKSYIGS
jgi:hypothetical protein